MDDIMMINGSYSDDIMMIISKENQGIFIPSAPVCTCPARLSKSITCSDSLKKSLKLKQL
jgi:hypothetical protein